MKHDFREKDLLACSISAHLIIQQITNMKNPMNKNSHTSTPPYQAWFPGARHEQASARSSFKSRGVPTPAPLPFREVHEGTDNKIGPPSTSKDSMQFDGYFDIPKGPGGEDIYGTCSIFLGVEDWGLFEVKNSSGDVVARIDLQEDPQDMGPQGGHQYHCSTDGAQLPSGSYTWSVTQRNIDYEPASGNVSICNYRIDVVPTEPGGQTTPETCPCEGDACSGDGGPPPPPSGRLHQPAGASPLGDSSSAGCSVRAESTATLMYWSCNFGSFRGLGGIPSGRIELYSREGVDGLQSPASLVLNHPLASYLDVPDGEIKAGSRFDLVQGGRVIAMRCESNGIDVRPVGVDAKGGGVATLVTENQQPCLQWTVGDGSRYLFCAVTGALLSYTTADKQVIADASAYLKGNMAGDGSLRQIWNLWDGLLNVENVTQQGYVISLYTPAQITGTDESGYYTVTGDPFKTFTLALSQDGSAFTVTEQTPGRQDYAVAWWNNGQAWNMRKGTGEDALLTTRTRSELEPSVWQLVTEQSKNGTVSSRTCEIYQTTDVGDLPLTRVEGYGTQEAQTTQYGYDQCGRLKTTTSPDGSVSAWAYDGYGRLLSHERPWAESGRHITRYTYVDSTADGFNDEIASETVQLRPLQGQVKTLSTTSWAYSIANHIKRTEKRITGMGVTGTRLSVTEQWLATAPNTHARGRTRMTQAVDGVQTWYDYTATTRHGALYTETVETRVNSEPVPGHSARTITWITVEGRHVREETHALLTHGTWALTGSADYQFDTQNRWNKKTRGNGRVTERALMCDGRTLWEIDEDGIRTDYAYNPARQLTETTRAAVMDGETLVTPETITAWTRDASGRELTATIYAGALQTGQTTAYDLLGRTTAYTDQLGRTTSYAYSADGLTTAVKTPSGATLITRSAPDGTVMEQSGTAQRHTATFIDLVNDGIRTCVRAITGETQTELQRSIVNGISEPLRTGQPNTTGGVIFTRHTYDAKGRLTQTQVDAESAATTMAPVLYEYDAFGNRTKETWKLDAPPTPANSRITQWAYGMEQREDGVYKTTAITRNNGQGTTYTETTGQLVSESPDLESKTVTTDPRGNDSVIWTEYGQGAERLQKSAVPSSDITATARVIDGFATTQTDHTGITGSQTRGWTANGITYTATDGRGNTTTTRTDIAGRTVSATDAADNTTTTEYYACCDSPAVITDALGHTACYAYDIRGRKTAQWGTGIQPACFAYDEADRMTSVTTYRVKENDITTDPTGRTDGDTTTWSYHDATGLLIQKTWADGTHENTRYNTLNMKTAFTTARGVTTTYGYNIKQGTNTSIAYSDATPGQQFDYNHLGQLTAVADASGIRNFTYNQYGEQETDSIIIEETAYLLTETRDPLGRSTGYAYTKGNAAQQTTLIGYDGCGRLVSAGFLHGGEQQRFTYGYLPETRLLQSLTHPNSITVTHSYEERRDLILSMNSARGTTNVVLRGYSYDALGRPVTRTCTQQAQTRHDAFTYNTRGELSVATLGTTPYGYDYDNIGNRTTAREEAEETTCEANCLNQYSSITREETPFNPEYDEEGNQTLVETSTGIWNVVYDANNRPVSFSKTEGENTSIITCGYDYMGRRYMKQVSVNGTVTQNRRYIYRGYLQIACVDLTRNGHPALWFITWDPTQSAATRPLAIQKDGTWYTYGHDLTKNVTELYKTNGTLATAYDYTPFGKVTANGTAEQPIQWSSECNDAELGLVYYNYRHYNPTDGRWINRDPITEQGGWNLYAFVGNNAVLVYDELGLTLDMKAPIYNTFSNIWSTYSVLAYTGDSNQVDIARPKEEGKDEFAKKVENGLCCTKVTKSKKLKISVVTVLPSDWGKPTLIDNRMTAFSRAGYNSTIQHEFRRRGVYIRANSAFLEPAENSGKEVTKCGWICRKSDAESEKALSAYLDDIRTEAKQNYHIYVSDEQYNIGQERTDNDGYEDWGLGFQVYVLKPFTSIYTINNPIPKWNTACPQKK